MIFVLAFWVPDSFLAVAFDSGGVTTGPITVPFIMALGLGLTAVRGDKGAEDDSFGLVALWLHRTGSFRAGSWGFCIIRPAPDIPLWKSRSF